MTCVTQVSMREDTMSEAEPLITKYRPKYFDEVVGHDTMIKALLSALKSDSHPHSFLLTGPRGVGKTSIARLIAKHFAAEIIEIAAAVYSGVDDMRTLVGQAQSFSFAGTGIRLILLDECHRLSRPAWDALLKLLEEPPYFLYIAMCTTEPDKVPETIRSRCYSIPLKPLQHDDLDTILWLVAGGEGWTVQEEIMNAVVASAEGSPRTALSMLQAVHHVADLTEARELISVIDKGSPLVELIQMLIRGSHQGNWLPIRKLLERMSDQDYEQAASFAARYIAGALLRSGSKAEAAKNMILLEALMAPAMYDRKTAFLVAVGRMVFMGDNNE